MGEKLLTFSANNRLAAFLIVLVLAGFSAGGLLKLEIDTSYDSLIGEDAPGRDDYDETTQLFGSDRTSIIYLRDANLFTADKLFLVEELVLALQDLPYVERVDSLFNTTSIRDQDGFLDSKIFMDLAPDTDEDAEIIKNDAIYSPLARGNLVSADGTVMAINVTVPRDRTDSQFNKTVEGDLSALLEPLRPEFEEIFQVGAPRLNVDIEVGMFNDLSILTPLSTLVLIIAIIVIIRLPVAAFIPMVTAGLASAMTLGFMGYMDLKLTLLTAIVPSLIIVIGSTEDMHLMAAYLEGLKEKDPRKALERRREAVKVMAHHVGIAIILTAFTTTLGFFSNSVNDIPLIRDFAYSAAFGMIANFIITLLTVPLILSFLGPLKNPLAGGDGDEHHKGLVGLILPHLENLVSNHGGKVAGVVAAFMVVFGGLATQVHVSNDPLSYFPDDHQLVLDADKLHTDLSGMQIFYVTLDSHVDDGFKNPEFLAKLGAVSERIRSTGAFDKVLSMADHLSLVNQEMNGADQGFYKLPETRNQIEQFLILFQRSDLERYASPDFRYANIVVRHNMSDSHVLNGHLNQLREDLPGILGEDITFTLTGENLMINEAAEGLFSGQVTSLLMIGVIIFIMMSIIYTSPFAGLMFLIPNLVPLVMNFGMMSIMGIPLNPGTASVAAIALGIAVDDSIHLFTRYRMESRTAPDQETAVNNTIRNEALAVVTTSFSLMIMYLTLTLSNFKIVLEFGLLAAMTMVYALISDLIITPLILRKVTLVSVLEIASLKLAREIVFESDLFRGMRPYQIKKAILLSKAKEFEVGEQIITEGTSGSAMYMVIKGSVEATVKQGEKPVVLGTMGPGNVFGEVGFVGDIQRTATVTAAEDVEVLVLEAEAVRKSLRFYPGIASQLNLNISRILGNRLANTNISTCRAAPVAGNSGNDKPTPEGTAS